MLVHWAQRDQAVGRNVPRGENDEVRLQELTAPQHELRAVAGRADVKNLVVDQGSDRSGYRAEFIGLVPKAGSGTK